ncbi:MAG TPA: PadR family transcriptional regulator [Clostridia bacterium]|nr:PadR family transcriptional regulator [Clostridia bacterium]
MLSHSSALILGIVAEKPINPYEVKKLLEKIEIKKWLPVAASSVYATIRDLFRKGYIAGEVIKEGNMPEKTSYSITEKGKDVLHDTLVEFLGNTELDSRKFNISSLMLCHLMKEEAVEILNGKISKLENKTLMLGKMVEGFSNNKTIPYIGLSIIKHQLAITKVEMSSIKELLYDINNDESWNHFMARDLGPSN